ncbi:Short-chain dehydrogenase [Pseudonocardia ammonioxydans]|uniref:Short-chain dehydrogenase n=1 Tax=Pseudonocardia ammonioxydans TaxID=260086 RepID=A0A1I5FVL0_PSUAM|nr:SDR family oxidoreductase [Pseudonocardia ammonioxydans]SFO27848.1 Short-chain dehydrogenase [Pseudonocardia ammonioxydans]
MTFDLENSGVVVTGGGAGIGAALARRFAQHGARVVVADLDADAARKVATDIGGHAVPGDAATEAGIDRLVETATAHLGAIDLFCANAGVAPHGGPEAPEPVWAKAWDVNVMAHVRAADRLLPDWLDRGQGRFLATVSAAGLLTMLGSAPYSVTKHATLGFAEWLSATYRHRGITVQALCPQGVRTDMLANAEPGEQMIMNATAIEPAQVVDHVIDALADDRFLILPHAEVAEYYTARAADTGRWIAGMNRLQQKVESAL